MILNVKNIVRLLLNRNHKYVFYSESKSYQKYTISFIKVLAEDNKEIIYISSDKNDKILHKNVKNIYVGNGLIRIFVFLLIKSKYFFLTVTDLGNNILKKNLNVSNYVYIFHAVVSVHKAYTHFAFNNYDTILCVGTHHNKEISKLENFYNLKKKKLINCGYFYFDYLKQKVNLKLETDYILIAPSWNYSKDNFLNKECEDILNYLLKKKNKIIFRPHPEHFKRSKLKLDNIKNKFKKDKNFFFDYSQDNHPSLERSHTLITDNSGIAIEFLLFFNRPVIYFDNYPKIHNKHFSELNLPTFEDKIKDQFGYVFKENKLDNLDIEIRKAHEEINKKKNLIENFTKNNIYNFCNSTFEAANYFKE